MNRTKKERRFELQNMLRGRENAMYEDLEERSVESRMHLYARAHAKKSVIFSIVVALLWYAVVATSMIDVVSLVASI